MTRREPSSSKPELRVDAYDDITYVAAWKVGVNVYDVDAAEVNRPGEREIRATFTLSEQEVRVWMDVATAARLRDGLTDALTRGRDRRRGRRSSRPHASQERRPPGREDAAIHPEGGDRR